MDIKHQQFQELLKQYADHQISREGYELLLSYIRENGLDEVVGQLEVMDRDWEQMGMDFPFSKLRSEGLYQKIIADPKFKFDQIAKITDTSDLMTESVINEPVTAGPVKTIWLYGWKKIIAAAAVLLLVGTGILFFKHNSIFNLFQDPVAVQYTHDIIPGKHTATITLANGKTIQLSDAKTGVIITDHKLTYNDGSKVRVSSGSQSLGSLKSEQSIAGPVGDPSLYSKNTDVKEMTASTPRGGTYQITLPDGTKVWLNAASTLKFPSTFAGLNNRIVELTGEAYFEVTKTYTLPLLSSQTTLSSLRGHRTKQSFIVVTAKQQVEVLGTHFNINAYADEPVAKTTLLEGSVKVNGNTILKPGQQSLLTDHTITVNTINTDEAVAWKEGLFAYNNTVLSEVMRQAARWYNVTIVYEDELLKQRKLSGSVTRYSNISGLLNAVSYTAGVKFKIENKTVTVMAK